MADYLGITTHNNKVNQVWERELGCYGLRPIVFFHLKNRKVILVLITIKQFK
jgi:hypothetical protein